MNQGNTVDAEEMTEEQAKIEIERTKAKIELLFEQMKRDREEGQRIAARSDAKLAEAKMAMSRLQILG